MNRMKIYRLIIHFIINTLVLDKPKQTDGGAFSFIFCCKEQKKILTDPEINSEPTIKVLEIIHYIYLT